MKTAEDIPKLHGLCLHLSKVAHGLQRQLSVSACSRVVVGVQHYAFMLCIVFCWGHAHLLARKTLHQAFIEPLLRECFACLALEGLEEQVFFK